jgi:hypothetical protein
VQHGAVQVLCSAEASLHPQKDVGSCGVDVPYACLFTFLGRGGLRGWCLEGCWVKRVEEFGVTVHGD